MLLLFNLRHYPVFGGLVFLSPLGDAARQIPDELHAYPETDALGVGFGHNRTAIPG